MPTATKTPPTTTDLEHIETALGSVMTAIEELTMAVDAKRHEDGLMYTPAEPPLEDAELAMRLVVFAKGLRLDTEQLGEWADRIEESAVERYRTAAFEQLV